MHPVFVVVRPSAYVLEASGLQVLRSTNSM